MKKRISLNPHSIGNQLFVIIVVAIVAVVSAVGMFSYNSSKEIIKEEVAKASQATVLQASDKIDIMMKMYESLSRQIIVDGDLRADLVELARTDLNASQKGTTVTEVAMRLNSYKKSLDFVESIRLVPLDHNKANVRVTDNGNSMEINEYNSGMLKNVAEAKGNVIWIATQKKGLYNYSRVPTFTLGRLLMNNQVKAAEYVMYIEINAAAFDGVLGNVKLGDTGGKVIVDSNNKIISASDQKLIEEKSTLPLNIDKDSQAIGSYYVNHKNKSGNTVEHLAAYSQSKNSGWFMVGYVETSELVKNTDRIFNVTLVMIVIAIVIGVGIGFLILKRVGTPLSKLNALMNEGKSGNLRVRMDAGRRKDEIGQVSRSFNEMMNQITTLADQSNEVADKLHSTAQMINGVSMETSTAAKEIAASTQEVAQGASTLAMEAEHGNEITGEINNKLQVVLGESRSMIDAASNVREGSEQGKRFMNVMKEKTNIADAMTLEMSNKVHRLRESTSSIRKILEVLDNMTKQTNILSLNATIEASRAGAAGKGFMVVADEIRKLADQSKQSIQVVGNITETIQHEIEETVTALAEAQPLYREQIRSVQEGETIFSQVVEQMNQFVTQLNNVYQTIHRLEETQTQLNRTMSTVGDVSRDSAASMEEIAALSNNQLSVSEHLVNLSDTLNQLSVRLSESRSFFK